MLKWANRNWTRFYKELLSQSFEVLQMWPRHTPPVSKIAIVSMEISLVEKQLNFLLCMKYTEFDMRTCAILTV